jgi:hypothetical protein
MGVWKQIGRQLVQAYRENSRSLAMTFAERALIRDELRDLVGRDLAILVHKRSRESENGERWHSDLEAFVTRSLRPKLAGRSIVALWSDNALMRALDMLVAGEQAARARAVALIPVTSRCGSHWAH